MDKDEDLRAHTSVEPGDDMVIILDLDRVDGTRGADDLGDDATFLEHDLEQGAPLGQVGRLQGEHEGDVLVGEHNGMW